MANGYISWNDFFSRLPEEEQVKIKEDTERMIREGLLRRDGFAHYVMYIDEHGETVTICLYIGVTCKDDVDVAMANIRGDLGLFSSYPPESEWQHEPDEETQKRCIEAWQQANTDKVCRFGVMGFISI